VAERLSQIEELMNSLHEVDLFWLLGRVRGMRMTEDPDCAEEKPETHLVPKQEHSSPSARPTQ
jgi:hypothetical protein